MKAFIFDLDGTLLDTLADLAAACNHTLALNGFPTHEIGKYRHMVGNGFEMLMARALAPVELAPSEFTKMVRASRDWYREHLFAETLPYPGLIPALQVCMENGVLLGVLSNKPDELTVELVEHFFPDILFAFVLGGRENRFLKPNPEELLRQLVNFKIKPENAFYIGDSDVDVETAKNAGVTSVGAAWGFRGREELERAGAALILHEPADIPKLLTIHG